MEISPQLTEHGDQSLQSVTAQCGSEAAALPAASASVASEWGHARLIWPAAHVVLFIVSTCGHFLRPILS